jgi:hypothetical protein
MGYVFVLDALLILLAIKSAKRDNIARMSPNSRHVSFVGTALASTFLMVIKHGIALVNMPGWMKKAVCIKSMRKRHIQIEMCMTARSSWGPTNLVLRKDSDRMHNNMPIGRGFQAIFPLSISMNMEKNMTRKVVRVMPPR